MLLNAVSRRLSFDTAMLISKQLMHAQGFGAGGIMESSGEFGVFRLVTSPAPVLFDVGGHIGEYTEAFLKQFPDGRSFVFEPSAAHVGLLRRRLGEDDRVSILPVGLSDRSGEVPLYKDGEVTGLASLTPRRLDHLGIKLEASEIVTLTTLDAVVEERNIERIDLLKIDVEGHDLAVLRGAERAFEKKLVKLVQFEFGGCNLDTRTSLQDFYYFFKSHGFTMGVVTPCRRIQALPRYDEFFEHYRTTNFVAAPLSAGLI